MTTQIIHCPTDAQDRQAVIYGTTWIINALQGNLVEIQYSVCSPDDVFSRKKGLLVAKSKRGVIVSKAELPKYINSINSGKSVYFVPDIYRIYQAVIRL